MNSTVTEKLVQLETNISLEKWSARGIMIRVAIIAATSSSKLGYF